MSTLVVPRSRLIYVPWKLEEVKAWKKCDIIIGLSVTGLQFLVEFQDDDARVNCKYVCNLCEDVLERRYVISHCFGKSHRYKYLVSFFSI